MSWFSKLFSWFEKKPKPTVDIVREHNKHRLRPLQIDDHLMRAAEKHAQWMAETGRMSHTGRLYSQPKDRAEEEEFYGSLVGENIAKTSGDPMTLWMQSSGHRSNITNENYRFIGHGRSGNYWCVIFGG